MAFLSSRSRKHDRIKPLAKAELEQVRGGLDQAHSVSPAFAGVEQNPLYVGSEAEGDNPLYV